MKARSTPFVMVVAMALLPTIVATRAALAQDDGEGEGEQDEEMSKTSAATELSKKKQKVLLGITADESVLINVTRKDLPASPDILNLGKRGTKALARCVADNVDDHVRTTCAVLLGRLGDRSSLSALQGALEAWNPSVRRAAIAALRNIPDPSSFEPLKKLLARDDEAPDNRAAVFRTLGMLSDQRAVTVLRTTLNQKDSPAQDLVPAFEGLWKSRHLMARSTLVGDVVHALKSGNEGLVIEALHAAAELRAPELVDALVPLMGSADSRVRNRAVYALGRIGDKAATSALLSQIPKVREARMLNNIAFALERLDSKAFYTTIEGLIGHKQASIRMNAAFVLGDVRRPEGLAMLKKALADPNDYVRVSSVSALSKIDAPEAIASLEPLIEDKNFTLRKEAILAIFALSGGKRKDLVWDKLHSSKNPQVRLEAALALGKFLDPRVAPDLMGCVEKRTCAFAAVEPYLRAAPDPMIPGRILSAWVKGNDDLTNLVAFHRPTGAGALATSDVLSSLAHGELRRAGHAVDLLGDLGDGKAPLVLAPLLSNDSTRLRLHASIALARFDVPDAKSGDMKLLQDLDNVPMDWLGAVVRVLSRVKEPTVRARLTAALLLREKGSDVPIAMAAAAVRLEWDPESAVFRCLDGLASKSALERDLSERYLVRGRHLLLTSLLRRALARESREPVKASLRKILDIRAGHGDAT
jgi:HEAT repeat protein